MLGACGDITDADNPGHLLVSVSGVMKKLSSLTDDCHPCGEIRCGRLWRCGAR